MSVIERWSERRARRRKPIPDPDGFTLVGSLHARGADGTGTRVVLRHFRCTTCAATVTIDQYRDRIEPLRAHREWHEATVRS